jgi:G:T/U-mismatch repair DNA glycosylase
MPRIRHKFQHHAIYPDTETLIVGTFNPDAANNYAQFFYGRTQNFLWRLLPAAFGAADLKGASVTAKHQFMVQHKVDFIDLISEVDIEAGQETNYLDSYLDGRITECRAVMLEMEKLKSLKRVCLTRKTLTDIPVMSQQIERLRLYCQKRGILFAMLPTPARMYTEEKQAVWTRFLTS